jgi:hypothetical protein
MTRVINIHDAKVKTMSVGIKAMTINDRQVTLAVFRQLMNIDLISDDGTLNGIPWGIINYHPDKCAEGSPPHFHVVWQEGEELRRATVGDPPRFDYYRSAAADDYVSLNKIRAVFFGDTPPHPSQYFRLISHKDIIIEATESQDAWRAEEFQRLIYGPHPSSYNEPEKQRRYFSDEAIDKLNAHFNAVRFQYAGWKGALPKLQRDIQAEAKRRAKWKETIQSLRQLPQLFIAV